MRMFDFGENWQEFSRTHVNPERLATAAGSLQNLLGRDSLEGLTFLDVGCGSGLFSIAASTMGAERVVGIDINPRSIAASEMNRKRLSQKSAMEFIQMSVLDTAALHALGQFDIAYAWGSLHHTGAMWQAIQNTSECVAPRGTYVLAIYNQHLTSPLWRFIKRYYSSLPRMGQEIIAVPFAGLIYFAKLIATRQNPFNKERGMDFWYDVIDWLGGYPYEYATPDRVQDFMCALDYGMQKEISAQVPTGCNEFVFERMSAKTEANGGPPHLSGNQFA